MQDNRNSGRGSDEYERERRPRREYDEEDYPRERRPRRDVDEEDDRPRERRPRREIDEEDGNGYPRERRPYRDVDGEDDRPRERRPRRDIDEEDYPRERRSYRDDDGEDEEDYPRERRYRREADPDDDEDDEDDEEPPVRRSSGGKPPVKKSSNANKGVMIGIIACCAILAVTAIVFGVMIVQDFGKKGNTTEAQNTQAVSINITTASQTEDTPATEPNTVEAKTTAEPVTEKILPDGTKYERPTAIGNAYILDGQVFSVACAGHSTADYYASMVNSVGEKLKGKATVYNIVAPTAFGACLSTQVQEDMAGGNQPEVIEYIGTQIDANSAKFVPAYENIIKHNAEYIYFNMDHHWTALGAYYAYESWCQTKGIKAHTLKDFKKSCKFEGFLGSFFKLAGEPASLESNRDTVYAVVPNGTNDEVFTDENGDKIEWDIIYDVTDWARTSKYNCFIGGDNPFTEIDNPAITDGSACILVKESYGNAFAPYLVDHYQHVYIVDYRYYSGNLSNLIAEKNVQDVIILNNMEAIGGTRADEINALFR